MCIAAVSPQNERLLTPDEFNECMRSNSDGMGLLYAEDGDFKILKTLTRGDLVYKEYTKAHYRGLNVILHFRIKTHGPKDVENCHPFIHEAMCPDDNLAYVHNGVLTLDSIPENEVDSRIFSSRILDHLPVDWYNIPDIFNMVEKFLGGSKMAFMNKAGEYLILNEQLGNTQKGIWFSNYGWRKAVSNYERWGYFHQSTHLGRDLKTGRWTKPEEKKETVKHIDSRSNPLTPQKFDFSHLEEQYENLWQEDHPAGFLNFGYFICSYCAPQFNVLEDDSMIPVFRHADSLTDEDDTLPKICESCHITVNDTSPVHKNFGLWNRVTGSPVKDEYADSLEVEGEVEIQDSLFKDTHSMLDGDNLSHLPF